MSLNVKHNKIKNTAILYELLSRQITVDVLNDTKSPKSVALFKEFFNKIGTTIEIKNEKSSINFWSTSGMMAPFYELLSVMTNWLVKRGIKRNNAQKYITSLFLALSEDAVVSSKKDLKYLVKESQTPKGLNEQGVKELSKAGFYKLLEKTLNNIHKRLSK